MYYSTSQFRHLEISEMPTPHIENALTRINKHKHPIYAAGHTVAGHLKDELLDRYRKQLQTWARTANHGAHTRENRYVPTHTLADLRDLALSLCKRLGNVTADTLRKALAESGRDVPGYALAYVFTDRRFKKIGFLRSTTPSNKGRFISVWTSAASV